MIIVKVAKKRQLTLPKEICDKLGISPGDYVKIYVEDGRVIIEKILGLDELAGILNPSYS
ncbi:MAG: AbrB family transcriptional regulator, partial [Thermoprotei archaeon]